MLGEEVRGCGIRYKDVRRGGWGKGARQSFAWGAARMKVVRELATDWMASQSPCMVESCSSVVKFSQNGTHGERTLETCLLAIEKDKVRLKARTMESGKSMTSGSTRL